MIKLQLYLTFDIETQQYNSPQVEKNNLTWLHFQSRGLYQEGKINGGALIRPKGKVEIVTLKRT